MEEEKTEEVDMSHVVMGITEAAMLKGVTRQAVLKAYNAGKLRGFKTAGVIMLYRESVEGWTVGRRRVAGPGEN